MFSADGNKEMMMRAPPARRLNSRGARMMILTARDREIVVWVSEVGIATREHVQAMFFPAGSRSRCQYRLTLLFRYRYLDRLPRRSPNAPNVYYLSRRSINGLRLIRASGIEVLDLSRRPGGSRLQHTLLLVSCRVKVVKACADAGMSLMRWLNERELLGTMGSSGILPDVYFQLGRVAPGGEVKRSGFFLEVERSDKTDRALREKFRRFGDFYYGGGFEERFGLKALRVLMLVGSDYGIRPERRVERMAQLAEGSGVTFLRFAALERFLSTPSHEALTSPIWRRPEEAEPVGLFSLKDLHEIPVRQVSSDGD